jgi:hypothetical protein
MFGVKDVEHRSSIRLRTGKFRLVQGFFNICWIFVWIALFVHYGETMDNYAELGLHVVQPSLYIAIESWCLFTLIVVMILLFKTLRDVKVDGRAIGSMEVWDLGYQVNISREGRVSTICVLSSGLLLPEISNLTPETATLPTSTL